MWRFNIIYKEQGTISIIELLAHKQNPLQSKQVFLDLVRISASAPARALLSFIFKTNALNIVMVRLVDAAGNNVTDYRADQPWEVLISAAAEGGEDLIMAQPDLCTRAGTDMISIKYVDFAGRLIAPYLLVDENEDEKFFHYLPDSAALATPWSELRAGMTDWSQTSPSTFQERLDGVFAKADKPSSSGGRDSSTPPAQTSRPVWQRGMTGRRRCAGSPSCAATRLSASSESTRTRPGQDKSRPTSSSTWAPSPSRRRTSPKASTRTGWRRWQRLSSRATPTRTCQPAVSIPLQG